MGQFFNAFKAYLVNHPNRRELKPTLGSKFSIDAMVAIVKELPILEEDPDDGKKIVDFIEASDYLCSLYKEMYKALQERMEQLPIKGSQAAEYMTAALNREYKVILTKQEERLRILMEGDYMFADMLNMKLESPATEIGLIDARAALETATDATSIVMNYLRFYYDKELTSKYTDARRFTANVIEMMQIASQGVVFKNSYDDILYNGGWVEKDDEAQKLTLDYDSHERLLLLKTGDMMFSERKVQVMNLAQDKKIQPRLYKYVTFNRIKKAKVSFGEITLDFGQGNAKEHKMIAEEMQSAIDAYYEYIDGNIILGNLSDATLDEAISMYVALQYIAIYVEKNVDFDKSMFTREDFDIVPRKIKKQNLIGYINKLTGVKPKKVKAVLSSFEADWKKFNDIWSSMLYPVEDYYLLPAVPIVNGVSYSIIDLLLARGGWSLDERGDIFEDYIFNHLTTHETSYPIICQSSGKYGTDDNFEEIDLMIGMKKVVVVGEIKCIHYSIEPFNYHDAWKRLKEGCEQARRKADFVIAHPEYFPKMGEFAGNGVLPIVVTNYPTFVGFEHHGVYVIDSHSLLAYMESGFMSARRTSGIGSEILGAKRFYHNEEEFSDNFEKYVKNHPIKELMKKMLYIQDHPILAGVEPWKVTCKSAQVRENEAFVLRNG